MTHGNVSWDTQILQIHQYMYTDCTLITERLRERLTSSGVYPSVRTSDLK